MKNVAKFPVRKRVIIFGASLAGRRTFEYYKELYHVTAFSDNDKRKIGTQFCGRLVMNPRDLKGALFDYVLIGSSYSGEITRQLVSLGIDKGKIGWVHQHILEGDFEGLHRLRSGMRFSFWGALVVIVLLIFSHFR